MRILRAIPVLMSVLSGHMVGCGPVPEGEDSGASARGSQGVVGSVKESSAELLTRSGQWEVCDDEARRVEDIRYGAPGSTPDGLVAGAGLLFFTADDGQSGRELWASEGGEGLTAMVKDVRPGPLGSVPRSLTPVGKQVFFVADDGAHGPELWRTDGTEQGTVLVKDVWPGPLGSLPEDLTAVGGLLYFTAYDRMHGRELWRSDGTAKGTVLVHEFVPGPRSLYLDALTAWDKDLVLVSYGFDGAVLWSVDKQRRLRRLYTREELGVLFDLTPVGSQLFFLVDEGMDEADLWVTESTPGTVRRLRHFAGEYPSSLTAMGGTLYFVAGGEGFFGDPGDPRHGSELWRSDGSVEGTYVVRDIWPGPQGSQGPTDVYPPRLVELDGVLYFAADDGVRGRELWRSDGTAKGTWLVRDVEPGQAGSDPRELSGDGGWLFFSAATSGHGREAWYSHGMAWDTRRLMDISPEMASSDPRQFVSAGRSVFFRATDGVKGEELWAVELRPPGRCY